MGKNKELHELLGLCWHEEVPSSKIFNYRCLCGYEVETQIRLLGKHIRENNPDYASDPRLVLREMMKREDFRLFMARLMYYGDTAGAIDWDEDITIDLILDTTGKLRDMAIEWLKNNKGNGGV
ncbi:MAG: hypothetical protein ABIG39_04520 [Candidatus Micrarchaeota archaeon]